MPRLPGKPDLGQLPSARTGRGIARPDSSGFTQGVKDLGQGISQLGASIAKRQKASEKYEQASQKYDTEARFQEFKWNQRLALDQAKFQTPSSEVDGFSNRWVDGYKEGAQGFLDTVPDSLKDDYNFKLKMTERQYFGDASKFMRTEQKRSALNRLDERKSKYLQMVQSGAPIDEIKSDYAGLVDANHYLSQIDKEGVLRKDYADMETAHVQARWQSGSDPGSVIRDLGGGLTADDRNPGLAEPAGDSTQDPASNDNQVSAAQISIRLETGKDEPLEGVSQVARDSGGTRSYGNFGLNSQEGGSIYQFVDQYGDQFGLTAEPGTSEFDKQWKNAARAAPVELHASEMQWYQDNVIVGITDKLTNTGVPESIAGDPRVQAYFADRVVQQGPASIDGMNKHRTRIANALDASGGNAEEFLKNVTEADRDAIKSDFPTALNTGVYSERGHDTRLNGRLNMALGTSDVAQTDPAYDGPYSNIPANERLKLVNKFREDYREKQRARAILAGELPVDPGSSEDKTAVDKAFESTDLLDKIAGHDWHASGELTRLAGSISYIPERAFETLRGMALNGTMEDRHYAYQTLGRIMRERPQALSISGGDGFNKDMADEIETFNTLITDVGLPAEDAIARIDEMRSPEFKERQKSMKNEANEVVKDLAIEDITREYSGIFTSRPAAGGSDRRASFMLDAYRDMVRHHYIRTGDAELAKKVALNEMTKAYKVSTITGNKRLMAQAPETYYPAIETAPGETPSYEYFQDELKRTVNEAAGRLQPINTDVNPELRPVSGTGTSIERGDQIPLEDIFIEANSETYADIAAGNPYPSYGVVWKQYDENGIPAFMTAPGNFEVDVKAAREKQSAQRKGAMRETRQENAVMRDLTQVPLYSPIMPQMGQSLQLQDQE